MGQGLERKDRGGNMERDCTNDLLEKVIWKHIIVEVPTVYIYTHLYVYVYYLCIYVKSLNGVAL